MNRREFITRSAAVIAASRLMGYETLASQIGANKRVGIIGPGWYGKSDLLRMVQVAPINIVSMCDVDSKMLNDAADLVATRQVSKKRPRLYSDWRKLLAEKDLDIVIIDPPDHWHALPMIEAAKSGLDIWVQKPISVDVVEGQAMLAAARKYNRVVQVGMQRRSTPHLVTARDRIIREGKLGKIAYVEIYCYYHMRASGNPPDIAPPANLDYEMWTGPAPMRPFCQWTHPRSWRAFMEYGNGIMGDMCVHMLDMTRWMLDLPMPTRIESSGGIFVDKASKANITDTQTATFEFPELRVVWTHRSWGDTPGPRFPWGAMFYGEKGTLEASVMGYAFTESGKKEPTIKEDVVYELDKYPEDRTEQDLEKHVAPAIRAHMKNFLECVESRQHPVSDIEQGYMSTSACILANVSMQLGRAIQWDHAKGMVVGDDAANKLLRRAYRAPWIHPDPKTV
jgi:predicted dehydrogenase